MKKESLDLFFENFFSGKWFMSMQKIFDINSHEVVGGELLLRVYDEDILKNGDYFPDAFYDCRFNNLTLGILRKLNEALAETPDIYPNHLSINLVPSNLDSIEIFNYLFEIAKTFRALDKNLALEISEIFVHEDFEKFLPKAEQLQKAGALIGLDDYGATDLEIDDLDFFPLDFVKLDRSMSTSVLGLNSKFHQNMIATAGKRNLMLIAEGVEEDDMLYSLKSFGYNFVQGFLFHKPEKFI